MAHETRAERKDEQHNLRLPPLHNGLDFIDSALEYLADPTDERGAKYAVLHLAAGVEVLLKVRLEREHWTLVLRDPRSASRQRYDDGDFISANLDDVLKRLTDVCGIELTEAKQTTLKEFKKKRNQIEHFDVRANTRALQTNAVAVLSVLLEFIATEFGPTELTEDEDDLLARIREKLSTIEGFVEHHRGQIAPRLAEAEQDGHPIVYCTVCNEQAVILDEDRSACAFCGHTGHPTTFQDAYLQALGHWSEYETVKNGGIWPVYFCDECGSMTLVVETFATHDAVCFTCATKWAIGTFRACDRCGERYAHDGDDAGMCDDCWAALDSRD